MKAFVVDKYKKLGPLRLADMPEPKVGNHDVCPINCPSFWVTMLRELS
jgi:hypothetical protein